MNSSSDREPAGPVFLTIYEVADRLGVVDRTVRRWIRGKKLVTHRFGKVVRISEADLRGFLAVHRDS